MPSWLLDNCSHANMGLQKVVMEYNYVVVYSFEGVVGNSKLLVTSILIFFTEGAKGREVNNQMAEPVFS